MTLVAVAPAPDKTALSEYDIYIRRVWNDRIIDGKDVKRAVVRHCRDLGRENDDDFLYRFDRKKADRAIAIAKRIRHTAGEWQGQPFQLQPFQAFIIAMIFGWVKKEDGYRRFLRSYISIARKNGKTELMALLMVVMFLFDGENRPRVYSAATEKDQAKECFDAAQIMIEYIQKESPQYYGRCLKISRNDKIENIRTHGIMRPLSRDRNGKFDGKNISCSVVDEYHAHPNAMVLNTLSNSTGSRKQPLTAVITTRGFDKESVCNKLESVYKDVLIDELEEDRTFIMIFCPDEGDDYDDPNTWRKGNPNLGISLYEDLFLAAYKSAKNAGGADWIEFLTKKLNVWTNQYAQWLAPAVIKSRGADYTLADLKGETCFSGLDLASRRDLAAMGLYFPYVGRDHKTLGYYFVPESNAVTRAENDRVKYLDWIRDEHLIATDGNITDYKYIRQKYLDVAEIVNIEEIAYDRFNSSQLIIDLQEDGFVCAGFGQGFISMNAPTKDINDLFLDGGILHNNNPVLTWAFSNVTLKIDPAGNWKVDKGKSKDKVDPVIAMIMARGQYMDYQVRNMTEDIGEMSIF